MTGTGRRLFLRQFWQQYHTTGAVWPSGGALSRELAHYVRNGHEAIDQPRRILEVGPGTGTVTAAIVDGLRPHDHLTLVEINTDFAAHLQRRFDSEPNWNKVRERVRIINQPIEEFPADDPFDLIVSGLPLNNFPVAVVANILMGFDKLAKPGATVSFFEYIAIRRFKSLVSGEAERTRLRGVAHAIQQFIAGREIRRKAVLANVPPAWAHHVQRQTEQA